MSPAHTPHVLLQKILEPGEKAQVDIDIAPGVYDLRTLEPGGVVTVNYEGGGFPALWKNCYTCLTARVPNGPY